LDAPAVKSFFCIVGCSFNRILVSSETLLGPMYLTYVCVVRFDIAECYAMVIACELVDAF
jgi:hypothetical protein